MGGVRGLGSFEGLRCAQDGSMRLRYVERKTYASEFERRTTPMSRQGSDGCTLPYDDMRNDGKPTKPMCFNNAQMHTPLCHRASPLLPREVSKENQ
jgi:hypothetical protein